VGRESGGRGSRESAHLARSSERPIDVKERDHAGETGGHGSTCRGVEAGADLMRAVGARSLAH